MRHRKMLHGKSRLAALIAVNRPVLKRRTENPAFATANGQRNETDASKILRVWRNGIRRGLKTPGPKGIVGSTPT
jgi:hypothetical protein